MKTQIVKINQIKSNPNNPRIIKDDKFKQLVESINNFPEMRDVRPIVVNKEMIILGGNMRWKAMQEAGVKEVPILVVDWEEEKQNEFVIKDNIGYGEWNWDILANEWDSNKLNDWGLNVPEFKLETKELDYSILDEADIQDQLNDMASSVRKAIQIEFEPEHYEEAQELVKFWREQKLYIGGFLIEKLKEEKNKL
jgi:ParB-like chromosome segregation protein Spo0J